MDFPGIKDYVLEEFSKVDGATPILLGAISDFLDRMLSPIENGMDKSENQRFTSEQLLSCIGIEIKHKVINAADYLEYFKKIDLDNTTLLSYVLFKQVNLIIRPSSANQTDFCITVFPLADIGYFVNHDDAGGKINFIENAIDPSRLAFVKRNIGGKIKNKKLRVRKPFDKGLDSRYYWFTTCDCFDSIKSNAHTTADCLGFSHLKIDDERQLELLYINLNNQSFETFKPNATLIDWEDSSTGYLSDSAAEHGRTFSVTGFTNYHEFIKERVCQKSIPTKLTSGEQLYEILINQITGIINSSTFIANKIDLTTEGLKRFEGI